MPLKIKKRIENLEQAYFPESKRRGFYLWELHFIVAFAQKYEGCEDSAPAILRGWYDLLQTRPRR